jgi:hypothetical protein
MMLVLRQLVRDGFYKKKMQEMRTLVCEIGACWPHSVHHAIEMMAVLSDIEAGDGWFRIIRFVTTANAFRLCRVPFLSDIQPDTLKSQRRTYRKNDYENQKPWSRPLCRSRM